MTDKRDDHGRRDDAPDKTVDADDLDPSPDTEPDLPAGPIETEEDTSVRESLSDFGTTLSTLVWSYAATMHTLVRDHALPWLGDQARNARSLPKRAKRRVILFAVGPSNTIGTRVGADRHARRDGRPGGRRLPRSRLGRRRRRRLVVVHGAARRRGNERLELRARLAVAVRGHSCDAALASRHKGSLANRILRTDVSPPRK